jgi:hypothetical protein
MGTRDQPTAYDEGFSRSLLQSRSPGAILTASSVGQLCGLCEVAPPGLLGVLELLELLYLHLAVDPPIEEAQYKFPGW